MHERRNCFSISDLLYECGSKYGEKVAIEQGTRTLTFKELNEGADRFATQLAKEGAIAGTVVPILSDRSIEWIVAALGVLRAGASYLPLDPAWPAERLQNAIEDCGARLVVASDLTHKSLDFAARSAIRNIDPQHLAHASEQVTPRPATPILPDDLAYLIYTSGTTGRPRGVEITHSNLNHLVAWHRDAFHVTETDRASSLAGLGFDAAVWEMWPNLAAGATLCLAPENVRTSPQLLRDWLLEERITLAFVPTVHASALMALPWPEDTALRLLLTGGDKLDRYPPHGLPFVVVNNYGPTECTVLATSTALQPGVPGVPSIGATVAHATTYLLDAVQQPVRDGDIGEIYIGGTGVARGYRNLPLTTGDAFLPDPFSTSQNARMYRTGDLGRRLANGELAFHGRLDRQVKVRGYRIELDEIASVLQSDPRVRFAAVVAEPTPDDDLRLVSYVLPTNEEQLPFVSDLQAHLQTKLPSYMIPAIFVRLQSLPLTANGKVDHKLLPPSEAATLLPSSPEEKPGSEEEQRLLGLMQELLGNKNLRRQDNFFLAGGHSLLGMQLILQVRKAFAVNLSLRQLFEAPSVIQLARVITELRQPAPPPAAKEPAPNRGVPVAEPALRNTDSVLPQGVLRMRSGGGNRELFWIHYPNPDFARAFSQDQPFTSLFLVEDDLKTLGERPRLQQIASCFVDKLLATKPARSFLLGGLCVGGLIAFEMALQLKALGYSIELLVLLDTPYPEHLKPGSGAVTLRRAGYLAKRAARLGPKVSLEIARERLQKRFPHLPLLGRSGAEMDRAQDLVERAAAVYQVQSYAGRSLLVLAADHSPHLNFLSFWRSRIPQRLHVEHVDAHHRDLMHPAKIQGIADVISPYLSLPSNDSLPGIRDHALPAASTGPVLTDMIAQA